jgi:hypothetical protein
MRQILLATFNEVNDKSTETRRIRIPMLSVRLPT